MFLCVMCGGGDFFHAVSWVGAGTETFRRMFGLADTVGDSVLGAPPLQCALGLPYYTRFGVTLALPFIVAGIGILAKVLFLGWRRWKRPNDPGTWWGDVAVYIRSKRYLTPVTFVFFLSYNMLTSLAMGMLDCRPEVLEGRRYLARDLSVVCYDAAHKSGIIVAALAGLCFSVAVPVAFVLYLRWVAV